MIDLYKKYYPDDDKLKNMLEDSEEFKSNYEKWENLIRNESERINFYDDNSKLSKFSKFSEKWGKRILMISFTVLAFTILGFLSEYVIEISESFALVVAFSFFVHIILSTLAIVIHDLRLPKEYLNQKKLRAD